MGGVFGVASKKDCVMDLFFGTDYHSHLGTKRGGMCVATDKGFERGIHNIENSPFRTKFEKEINTMKGHIGIGCISDGEPQPLNVYSKLGEYAIGTVGKINNKDELIKELITSGFSQFMAMGDGSINNTELVAALISTGKDLVEGLTYAQEKIDGSMSIVILTKEGIYASRDRYGRTPLIVGKKDGAYCVASESFSFLNLGYKTEKELGPYEIVFVTDDSVETLKKPSNEMKICTFLWTYFGYSTTTYEGVNVEQMRYDNGALLAKRDEGIEVDYVAGVPDSGVAHAMGYARESKIPFSRPLIKYTPTWPRSFMPQNQNARELIAKMKLIPVSEIIRGNRFVLIDDSIVRGTQLLGTTQYLKDHDVKEIHVRSACPPIMYGCKYLNFSRSVGDMDMISRRIIDKLENGKVNEDILQQYVDDKSERHEAMVEEMKNQLEFTSLKFQRLEDTEKAVGIESCKLCTYCWSGKE